MRISDWSSDVCSSDLVVPQPGEVLEPDEDAWPADGRVGHRQPDAEEQGIGEEHEQDRRRRQHEPEGDEVAVAHEPRPPEIGRASGGERVCQYGRISGGAVTIT